MIKKNFLLLIGFCFSMTIMQIVQANSSLDKFYQQTQSMQADFEQTISDTRGKILEKSSGSLIFSRPDKFILEYIKPSEQKYISNGKTIWIYDVELEQVNIKSIDEGISDSPALLLSSNTNIYKYYQVNDAVLPSSDKYQWIQLASKKSETSFERILLAFINEKTLAEMVMYDNFGQITKLKFSNIQINKPFSYRQFNLVAPEGVNVMGEVNEQ
jgi:outer membrane lipoprotein carrier protein